MAQTIQLPMLSLAMPNSCNMNSMDADSLSCMWNVFSKCKDSLEDGRRLENMSWRLWYREIMPKEKSIHKLAAEKARHCFPPENSIPLNKIQNVIEPSGDNPIDQSVSSHCGDNSSTSSIPIETDTILNCISSALTVDNTCSKVTSHNESIKRNSKFFIDDDDESDDEELRHNYINSSYAEGEDTEINSDCESFETFDEPGEVANDNTVDEAAFMIEFRKQSPSINILSGGQSLLTTLLRMETQSDQAKCNDVCQSKVSTEHSYHLKYT